MYIYVYIYIYITYTYENKDEFVELFCNLSNYFRLILQPLQTVTCELTSVFFKPFFDVFNKLWNSLIQPV